MPAKNPRINVVLDAPLYNQVQFLAGKDGVSLSTKVRDLLKEAMEIHSKNRNLLLPGNLLKNKIAFFACSPSSIFFPFTFNL